MTTVVIYTKGNYISAVECSGHTGYAEEGWDIVCAAVSSIIQTAVLGLMQVAKIAVDYKVEKDKKNSRLRVALPKNMSDKEAHDADVILQTMYLGVSDLYQEYSDYIKLEVKNDVY
jgi:uncharacterized protein YsxB (DUF464 family)